MSTTHLDTGSTGSTSGISGGSSSSSNSNSEFEIDSWYMQEFEAYNIKTINDSVVIIKKMVKKIKALIDENAKLQSNVTKLNAKLEDISKFIDDPNFLKFIKTETSVDHLQICSEIVNSDVIPYNKQDQEIESKTEITCDNTIYKIIKLESESTVTEDVTESYTIANGVIPSDKIKQEHNLEVVTNCSSNNMEISSVSPDDESSCKMVQENSLNLSNPDDCKFQSTKCQCPICNLMVGERYLNRHIKLHRGLLEKCNKCKRPFISLKNHKCRQYECVYCKKTCYVITTLRKHLARHHTVIICNICDESFRSSICFLNHKRLFHKTPDFTNNTKDCICDYCSKAFKRNDYLRSHVLRVHTPGYRRYNCDKCDGKYYLERHYKTHMKVHEQNCVICERCNVAFAKTYLVTHSARMHNVKIISPDNQTPCSVKIVSDNIKPSYQCNICDEHFTMRSTLKRHLSVHTGEKPYKCKFCHKFFRLLFQLQKHLRIHTGEKTYKCEFCNKTFRLSRHLKVHTGLHTGERPFVCNICSEAFKEAKDLRKHSKRYHCSTCTTSFVKKDSLKKHLLTHIGLVQ